MRAESRIGIVAQLEQDLGVIPCKIHAVPVDHALDILCASTPVLIPVRALVIDNLLVEAQIWTVTSSIFGMSSSYDAGRIPRDALLVANPFWSSRAV
jgi:hypothetical protein